MSVTPSRTLYNGTLGGGRRGETLRERVDVPFGLELA